MYESRVDAGEKLLASLPRLDPKDTVVVALPRGGVPVAEVIADGLGAPLDIVLVRKVGVPNHKELALAAVTDGSDPKLTVNPELAGALGLSEDDIWQVARPELAEIARRRKIYLGGRASLPVQGKTVLVVDDGIATGATMRASLQLLRAQKPNRLILAVPVAPEDTLRDLAAEADEVICLETPSPFIAVGAHYWRFDQVSDEAVTAALARNAAKRQTQPQE